VSLWKLKFVLCTIVYTCETSLPVDDSLPLHPRMHRRNPGTVWCGTTTEFQTLQT
jgi:hypothetical protein